MKDENTKWSRPDGGRPTGRLSMRRQTKRIEAAIRKDPDAAPLDFDWSEAVLVIPPRKRAISIRLDEDVLDYFKKEGAGYQRRMNAVLRSYMHQKQRGTRDARVLGASAARVSLVAPRYECNDTFWPCWPLRFRPRA